MPRLLRLVMLLLFCAPFAACAPTPEPVADLTPPPAKKVYDAKRDLESPRRR